MKKILILTMSILLQLPLHAASEDSITVRIKGMKCGECAHKVMTAIRKLPGIESVVSNLERRTTTVVFDPAQTCADSIKSRLAATHRFKATPYSPTDVIRRGFGLRMDDMHCQNCANRIVKRLQTIEGIDSLAPHVDKHYVFIRYDANRTCKDVIRKAVSEIGYTPVNYYTGKKISFAYYNIPEAQATQQTIDDVLILDGVEDVNVNAKRQSLAITYFNDETTAEKLLAGIHECGVKATLPQPHECKEEKQQ